MKIANIKIEVGDKVLVIAEAGVNHNGDLKLAIKLIDEAKKVGADAIKFQAFKASLLASSATKLVDYQKKTGSKNQYELLKKLELSDSDFLKIKQYCAQKEIIFLSSVFDEESVKLLAKLNIAAYKIGSGELTNLPLLGKIANYQKPMIVSTGMANLQEIRDAIASIKQTGNNQIILLHCTTSYPAKYRDVNLRAMLTLKNEFKLPVGFSDHTEGIEIALAAVALGARVIEKHFTLDRHLPGPDQLASSEPDEFRTLVRSIRNLELALGSGLKKPTQNEIAISKLVRKSIFAVTDIKKVTRITSSMLTIRRPEIGMSPGLIGQLIGKTAHFDIKKDEPIMKGDIR